jgi:hypothetical protein
MHTLNTDFMLPCPVGLGICEAILTYILLYFQNILERSKNKNKGIVKPKQVNTKLDRK